MAEQQTDRVLLAGILAMQLDFIAPGHLVEALREWSAAKSQALGDILVAAGRLDAKRRGLLDKLVDEHLKQHADDPAQCLEALSVSESLRDDLLRIADPDIAASLTRIHSRQKEKSKEAEKDFDPYDTLDKLPEGWALPKEAADPYGTQMPPEAGASTAEPRKPLSRTSERYRILRMYAKGGLGMVSVAEDGELHREVALKEIQRQHSGDVASRARFMAEAEITGRLEHPGIVPVYGLGQYADGRPYYAMRFIRGQSLRKAIEAYHRRSAKSPEDEAERLLEFRGLLGRFIAVCNTMEYAHSRGILHRDLKPDNIMLGDYGETLVVDWGLAKATGQPEQAAPAGDEKIITISSSSGSGETLPGSALGTPHYMSPEQAAGRLDELSPATDIYSLGATLYHLLTGYLQYDKAGLEEILRRVCQGDYPPPRARRPSVPPALEAICLKALALLPQDRYASARLLAVDIEHWLADEPVAVYPEPWPQRLARWTRRHRAAAQATVAALAVVSIVAVIATLVINGARQREGAAKVQATLRSQQSREVIDTLLTSVGQTLENFPGMQEARKRLLERAAEDYLKLTDAGSPDPELRAEAARAFVRLGDVRTMLGQLEQAEGAYRSAESLWRDLCRALPLRSDFTIELGKCVTGRAIASATRGRSQDAESAYKESLAVLEPLARSRPDDAEAGDALGTALVNLGRLQDEGGRAKEAEATLQRAVEAFEKGVEAAGAYPRLRFALAAARSAEAQFLVSHGREQEAIPVFQKAIKVYSQLVDDHPGEASYRSALGSSRSNLAAAYRDAGRAEDEVAMNRRAAEEYATLLKAVPDVPRYRENLAVTRTNLGQGLHKLGQNAAALGELQKSLGELDELSSEFPAVPGYLEGLAATRAPIARVLRDLTQFDEAQGAIEQALTSYGQLVEALPDVPLYRARLGLAHCYKARILAEQSALPEAEQEYLTATAELQRAVDAAPHDPHFRENLAATCQHWAWLRHRSGDSPGCREVQQRALALLDGLIKEFPKTARFADSAAWLLATGPAAELRDLPRAADLAGQATTLVPLNDFFWRTLGAVQYERQDYAAAQVSLKKAQNLRPSEAGLTYFLLAMAEWKLGNEETARELHAAACAWSDKNKPGDSELQRFRDQSATLLGVKVGGG